ncbi:MBL fold metallo-hydrolase [Cupriavidus sp. 2MCAB6]|uniref:MBL fold metallo-hydrolase n=1 Tax=Cupriavidus sp. 2MCAB6 TaxID=3232981 RepID=UPI003F9184DE
MARNPISSLLFTHFHGDHFGALPAFLLDAQFVSRRNEPLTIAGPAGIECEGTDHCRRDDVHQEADGTLLLRLGRERGD